MLMNRELGIRQQKNLKYNREHTERSQVCKARNYHDHPQGEMTSILVYDHVPVDLSRMIKKNPWKS